MNKKYFLKLTIIIAALILICSKIAYCREKLLLSSEQIQKLDKKGRVHLLKILDSGEMIFLSQRYEDENRLLVSSRSGRIRKWFKLPTKEIDYIVCSEDGKNVALYSQDSLEFFYLHGRRMKSKSIFRYETGKKGFALYGKEKSRMFFSGDKIFARGYYYTKDNQYLEDAIVRINPDKWGIAVFSIVVETNRLLQGARAFYKKAENTGTLEVCGKYLVLTPGDKNGGVIMLYDMEEELLFKLDDFISFAGMAVYPEKSLLLYCKSVFNDYKTDGEMILYDLKNKKLVNRWDGRYFNPRFDEDGERIVAGLMNPLYGGKYITHVNIIPVSPSANEKEKKNDVIDLVPTCKPIDWRLVNRGKDLYLFNGEEVFKWKLK